MLKSIKIKNFYSFGEEQEISFDINHKDFLDDSARHHKRGSYLNTVVCIIGSNASGKTNALRALSFLGWFIRSSYSLLKVDRLIPLALHKLHPKGAASFEVEFYENDILYRYYIELNQKEVLKERLDKTVKRINKTPIFELTRNPEAVLITDSLPKPLNPNDWERIKERANVSLLSALIDLGYLSEITFFKNIKANVTEGGYMPFRDLEPFDISRILYQDKELQEDILSFSKNIDLGIAGFEFIERPSGEGVENTNEAKKFQLLECIHNSKMGNFKLPIFYESNGTLRGYSILSNVLVALRTSGLIVMDEIEDGLHPAVIKKIISLFESKETNPNNAQLIFSTHQHLLLNDRTKTQIFLANKSADTLETEIYRLDDVEGVRNDENYFQKYIAGVYGGTPDIKWI